MTALYELKISGANATTNYVAFVCLGLFALVGIGFIVKMMLLPGLQSRKPIFSTLFSLGLIAFVAWACVYYVARNRISEPLVILYQEGLKARGSSELIPYSKVKIEMSRMRYFVGERNVEIGDALKLRIEDFKKYVEVSGLERIGNQYDEEGSIKFPVGDGGISETQLQEFIQKFNELQANSSTAN